MTPDERDRELSRLFEAERRADESDAPDLEALLARTRRRRSMIPDHRLVPAVAMAILVAATLLLVRGARRPVTPATEAVQLADWKSPTEFLLETPGSELLTQIPTLSSDPIVENASPPPPTKGVAR